MAVRAGAAVGAAVLAVGAAWLFLGDSGYWPGASLTRAWESDRDGTSSEDGAHRTWAVGDTLVRGRFNSVTGFEAGTGRKRWEYLPPGHSRICATSTAVDGSLVLVAYGDLAGTAGRGCPTVAALDLSDGRELWHGDRRTWELEAGRSNEDLLAVGGGLGVVLDAGVDAGAVRAVDLRTGAARWTAAVPAGCLPGKVASAPGQVLAVLTCEGEVKLAAFDPGSGASRWTVPLDERRGVADRAAVTVVSTAPIVLRADERGQGLDAFLVFGPDGRPTSRVEATGEHYGSIGTDFAVSGGRLFAHTTVRSKDRLVAFDLTTGTEAWQADIGRAKAHFRALHAEDGRVMVLMYSSRYHDSLTVLDARTGDEKEDRAFRDHAGDVVDVFAHGGLVITVRAGGGARPFAGYERW
ncbi:PQQ-binding-like beta-propeller repeat protein [Kitasatospora sp. NPDC059646]|uniref:outer membrane protein assembly factor BamB family protein n=1 Tax=Kitasatospora sp. NPDC059646 TaxID=3346893 RepID=UPI00367E5B70